MKLAENKYNRLLTALFLVLMAIGLSASYNLTKITVLVIFLLTVLSTVRQVRPGRLWVKFYAVIVVSTLFLLVFQAVGLLNWFLLHRGPFVMETMFFIVFIVPILLIQKEIFTTEQVTADTLKGGIAVYILLALAWATFYNVLFELDPKAFSGITLPRYQADFLHFSFVTLTTVGYGDIHPVAGFARVTTDLEAVVGVLYPSILISRLVNLYNTKV